MPDISLKDFAKKTGLAPKLVRRLIRKRFPRQGESGKYIINTDSAFYKQLVTACNELKKETTKKEQHQKAHPKRERGPSVSKSEINDDRGFLNVDGNIFAIAIIPRPDDPSIQDVKSVWLGRTSEVLPYIEGKTKTRPVYQTSEQELALRDIVEGKCKTRPSSKGESVPKSTKKRRLRHTRLAKRG